MDLYKIYNFCKRHATLITALATSGGVIATGVSAAIGTVKAQQILAEQDDPENMSFMEKAKVCVKPYIPALAIGTGTICGIFFLKKVTPIEMAALGGGAASYKSLYDKYGKKVKEQLDTADNGSFIDEIEIADQNDIPAESPAESMSEVFSANFNDGTDPMCIFYDPYSKRFFKSTKQRVLQAEYHLNRRYSFCRCQSLNNFYELLGIPKVAGGDSDMLSSPSDEWVDFKHPKRQFTDGTPYYEIQTIITPIPANCDWWM